MACGKPPRLALGPRGAAAVLLLRLTMEPACGSIYALVRWPWLSPWLLQEATLMHPPTHTTFMSCVCICAGHQFHDIGGGRGPAG